MTDWWLIVSTPDGRHVWQLGDVDAAGVERAAAAARALVGFPAGDEWIRNRTSPWCVQCSAGEPHESLMARATVHDAAELEP